MRPPHVVALVAAHNEAGPVASTVAGLGSIAGVSCVVVVDDGSTDGTSARASAAGARVIVAPRRLGKGSALEGALNRLPPADVWLFADADLGATASGLAAVLGVVLDGRADVAVAVLPTQPGGGFGLVRRLATWGIRRASGFRAAAPLSGQRALTSEALAASRPLSMGFGVETGMTIDVVRSGYRVVEVPAPLTHRATGRGPRGFAHRARQGLDIVRALADRRG